MANKPSKIRPRIIQLWEQGIPQKDIKIIVGCSKEIVAEHIRNHKFYINGKI